MGIRKPNRHCRTELIYLGMSTKQYRPWSPEQPYLLPPSPQDWLPPDHLAYFILDVVSKLDLSAIEAVIHAKDPRGERPYSPQLMVALLLYSYCTGTFSSRKIERSTYEDLPTRTPTTAPSRASARRTSRPWPPCSSRSFSSQHLSGSSSSVAWP
jgi:hypothetical protein